MSTTSKPREFTGRHMLAIMVAFFGVVITVNLTMAYLARSSWTGFVVENTYIASQKFNQKAAEGREQAALGWTSNLAIADGRMSYRLTDKAGNVVAAKHGTAHFRRPAYAAEDLSVELTPQPDGALAAAVAAHDGLWIVEVDIDVSALPRPYRDVRRLTLRDGRIQ